METNNQNPETLAADGRLTAEAKDNKQGNPVAEAQKEMSSQETVGVSSEQE